MTDFEKRLQARLEKAAERTLTDKLNAVDWERLPVKKVIGGTLLAIIAWKLARPIFRFIRGCIELVVLGPVLAIALAIALPLFNNYYREHERLLHQTTVGVENPQPVLHTTAFPGDDPEVLRLEGQPTPTPEPEVRRAELVKAPTHGRVKRAELVKAQ
jgi:hypothetical protein